MEVHDAAHISLPTPGSTVISKTRAHDDVTMCWGSTVYTALDARADHAILPAMVTLVEFLQHLLRPHARPAQQFTQNEGKHV